MESQKIIQLIDKLKNKTGFDVSFEVSPFTITVEYPDSKEELFDFEIKNVTIKGKGDKGEFIVDGDMIFSSQETNLNGKFYPLNSIKVNNSDVTKKVNNHQSVIMPLNNYYAKLSGIIKGSIL